MRSGYGRRAWVILPNQRCRMIIGGRISGAEVCWLRMLMVARLRFASLPQPAVSGGRDLAIGIAVVAPILPLEELPYCQRHFADAREAGPWKAYRSLGRRPRTTNLQTLVQPPIPAFICRPQDPGMTGLKRPGRLSRYSWAPLRLRVGRLRLTGAFLKGLFATRIPFPIGGTMKCRAANVYRSISEPSLPK